ncbi:unnamed protein product [Adineta steineri]|uniref:Uncharacterized protein n=1 Tax=Adineta steineri TaxID=433720 RepID=A0A814RYG9_9BILA|nr:unnamed protein product [Adineta steineri]
MMNNIGIFILLVFACVVINGQWITEKHVDGIIDRDDDYWVVKTNGKVNRPKYPAYIRFYNTHTCFAREHFGPHHDNHQDPPGPAVQ